MNADHAITSAGSAQRHTVGDGLLIVDKPAGWTSHDVVGRSRRLCATRKVGHAGTLDPMATGVLVLGVNRATKLLTYLVGLDKTYQATMRLGATTVTDDAEGEILTSTPVPPQVREQLPEAIQALTGAIDQVPSAVSAIKVDGKRSYARVRSGEQVELSARPVRIEEFAVHRVREVTGVDSAAGLDLDVTVRVSSGTYVRALARDLGVSLGVGGHLTALRRTQVGPFDLAQAATLEQIEQAGAAACLLSMGQVARSLFPVRELAEAEVVALRFGQRIGPSTHSGADRPVAGIGPDGTLVALLDEHAEQVRSHVVFPAD